MITRFTALLVLTAVVMLSAADGRATPVTWTSHPDGEIHHYELIVIDGIEWEVAKAAAEAQLHEGRYGHLVSVTSAAEHAFILANVLPVDTTGYHIGAQQLDPSGGLTSGWSWVTPEAWSYTHWASGEPNNAVETRASYIWRDGTWGWNDIRPLIHGELGYIVEYDHHGAPEPGSFALLAIGLCGLGVGVRCARKRRI